MLVDDKWKIGSFDTVAELRADRCDAANEMAVEKLFGISCSEP